MDLKYFKKQLIDRKLKFRLNEKANEDLINNIEKKLNIHFPLQVRLFYSTFNGLFIKEPTLLIYRIEELEIDKNHIIEFCKINNDIKIGFKSNDLNNANQWDIINTETNYIITLTMASFWSNKIFAWVDKRRKIWDQEIYNT